MIERTSAFKTSDGQTFAELPDAQKHELELLLEHDDDLPMTVSTLLEHADKIVDILTTGPRSKPKARKIHGGTKKRKSAAAEVEGA